MSDISHTIIAKSDQLNAGDLFGGAITVQVVAVNVAKSADQPVSIKIDGDHQPYKPCLSMRRILAKLWGLDSSSWVGRSMTLYCDETVRWAGAAVGGIRISHLTNIGGKEEVTVRASSKHTTVYTIMPLSVDKPAYSDADIAKNEAAWKASFADGKSSSGHMIQQIKTKFTLTAGQEKAILALGDDT